MILLFVFLSLLTLSYAVIRFLTRPSASSTKIEERLAAIRNAVAGAALVDDEYKLNAPDVSLRTRCEVLLTRFALARPFMRLCKQSGATLSFFDLAVLSLLTGLFVAFAVTVVTHLYLAALLAGMFAALVPTGLLRLRRTRRVASFEELLPDTIELMARALRAGHSVQQMLEVIADQTRDPIRAEFAHVHQQQKLGIAFRDAMQALADRVPSQDLRFVVTAILVQKETGGDLIEILDRTALVIRDRRRVAGEVRTLTAEGRLTGWILSALPVILLCLLLLITPGYVAILLSDPVGHMLLAGGVFMILTGAYLIRRIVDVEV